MNRGESESTVRHHVPDLLAFAEQLLDHAGLARDRAQVVAEVLLEGDLLGHTTHGLALLARYLDELAAGRMETAGDPATLQDRGSALTWDGRRLPGPCLVRQAIAVARERVRLHPVVTVSIRRSHHIGCLQAYLKPVTDEGLVILLTCSDPSTGGVAPHGGVASRITPNPIAAGFPTGGDPVLIDVSMSTTTNARTRRAFDAGERLPGPWLVDADGKATDDPSALFGERPGAILPLGGLDLGHKGFALALLVEALTSGLAGHGRADEPKNWGASVFLQLIDPDAFGGRGAFTRETTRTAELCRSSPVAPGAPPVRLPGEAALQRRADQLREGVALEPSILPALEPWAERWQIPVPKRAQVPLAWSLRRGRPVLRANREGPAPKELSSDDSLQQLLAELSDSRPWVRANAAHVIGHRREGSALEALVLVLRDKDVQVREAAARAIGEIGDPRAISALLMMIKEERVGKPSAAASALAKMGRPAFEAMVEALADPDPNVRFWAGVGLGRLGDKEALGHLRAAAERERSLTCTRADVRLGLEKAIARLGSPD